MDALRWEPRIELSGQEKALLSTVKRTRRLFGFLRQYRTQLFDEPFQAELAAVYRSTGAGKAPHPPAFMAMVVLLQMYTQTSDAEAVQRAVVDLLWQMTLDCLGATRAPFSQGALHDFRQRLIAHDLDRRLLERTAELAKETGAFDAKKLPKTLRVAVDSKPLRGAGRVEDTLNLLGHAARDIVRSIAVLLDEEPEDIARAAKIPLLLKSSTKLGLDIDWTDPKQKTKALQRLLRQLANLVRYVRSRVPEEAVQPPLSEHLKTLQQFIDQDLEPDPDDPAGKKKRIRGGVAKDRRISVRDPDMRHGRKSRTKRFNGFKQHVAVDLDSRLILACTVRPGNQRDYAALHELKMDISRYDRQLAQLQVDRGYITSETLAEAANDSVDVLCKPRQMPPNNGRFTKRDFKFDLRAKTVTCPAGQHLLFRPGERLRFDEHVCRSCSLRSSCTTAQQGRVLALSQDEIAQQGFLRLVKTKSGRQRLRERIAVEHRLAHIKQKQGDQARYVGGRANLYDLRRAGAILNLEIIDHELRTAA